MKAFLITILSLCLIMFVGFIGFSFYLPKDIIIEQEVLSSAEKNIKIEDNINPRAEENQNNSDEIIIYAVGDIMLDRGVKYVVEKYGDKDYKFPFLNIADYLSKADITFGNLESQISDKGKKIGTVNSFRADPKAIDGLKYAGFDVVSVANNHFLDYDRDAMEDSFNRLKTAGIMHIGGGSNEDEAFLPKIIEIKGVKIGFLAYCAVGSTGWRAGKDSPGIAFITNKDIKKIKEDIKKAKEKVDILIVSSHAGTEYQVKSDSSQQSFYRSFIQAGADLVLGHHPHVAQELEGYPPGWIQYSLGNFVFDQGFSEATMKGILLEVKIKEKKIQEVSEKQIEMNKNFQPELVKE